MGFVVAYPHVLCALDEGPWCYDATGSPSARLEFLVTEFKSMEVLLPFFEAIFCLL